MTSKVNKRVHKTWRRETFAILTGYSGPFHQFLTELLTVGSSCESQLKSTAQQQIVRQNVMDVWNAARLGFSGAKRLTLPQSSKATRLILATAFDLGARMREETKLRYANAAVRPPSFGRGKMIETLTKSLENGTFAEV